jgi:hypothetical protein
MDSQVKHVSERNGLHCEGTHGRKPLLSLNGTMGRPGNWAAFFV